MRVRRRAPRRASLDGSGRRSSSRRSPAVRTGTGPRTGRPAAARSAWSVVRALRRAAAPVVAPLGGPTNAAAPPITAAAKLPSTAARNRRRPRAPSRGLLLRPPNAFPRGEHLENRFARDRHHGRVPVGRLGLGLLGPRGRGLLHCLRVRDRLGACLGLCDSAPQPAPPPPVVSAASAASAASVNSASSAGSGPSSPSTCSRLPAGLDRTPGALVEQRLEDRAQILAPLRAQLVREPFDRARPAAGHLLRVTSYTRARASSGTRLRSERASSSLSLGSRRSSAPASCSGWITGRRPSVAEARGGRSQPGARPRRRGWDSNPRGPGPAGFQGRCIQPLCHPSGAA